MVVKFLLALIQFILVLEGLALVVEGNEYKRLGVDGSDELIKGIWCFISAILLLFVWWLV